MGRDGSVYLMGWTGGYVLLALLLAPYLPKFGKYTVPDFVGDRYYSRAARVVAVVCAIFVSFTYVAGQMRGVGIVFSRFLNVEITSGVLIGMGIVFFYAVLGGMKGITYTQVAQYCVLIFAYLVPAIFISLLMTGNIIPQLGFGGTLADGSGEFLLDRLNGLSRDLGFHLYTDGSKATIDVFCITAALMVGTAGLPHVIVRFYTVPRVADARSSAGWALFFIALLYTTAPAVAAFARTNLLTTISERSYQRIPDWFKNWEETGLLAWADKNSDGKIQYVAGSAIDGKKPIFGSGRGASGERVVTNANPNTKNELYVDRDIMVLANPEIAKLPNWIVGLVAARIAAGVAVCIAGYFGINPPGFVGQVVAFAFGLAAASFFPAIVMGIFSKRMNKFGAISGMIVGITFTAGYIMFFKFIRPELNTSGHWLLGISPEGIGILGMILNFVVSITVSALTPPPPGEIQELVEYIRVPRAAGEARELSV